MPCNPVDSHQCFRELAEDLVEKKLKKKENESKAQEEDKEKVGKDVKMRAHVYSNIQQRKDTVDVHEEEKAGEISTSTELRSQKCYSGRTEDE